MFSVFAKTLTEMLQLWCHHTVSCVTLCLWLEKLGCQVWGVL